MNHKIRHLVIFFFGMFSLVVHGNNKSTIYNCYINSQMPVWKSCIDRLDSQVVHDKGLLPELINYQYGYIGWCLENNQKEQAITYLKRAGENVENLDEMQMDPALVNAYKAAFLGFHIAINKFSAPLLGPKSAEFARQAVLLNPTEPFGYIQSGNVQLHTPALLGGSKKEALAQFLKAKSLMEKKPDEVQGDWNYLYLLTQIAKTYESLREVAKAKLMYEEILRIEPGFKLIRDDLYPKLINK